MRALGLSQSGIRALHVITKDVKVIFLFFINLIIPFVKNKYTE